MVGPFEGPEKIAFPADQVRRCRKKLEILGSQGLCLISEGEPFVGITPRSLPRGLASPRKCISCGHDVKFVRLPGITSRTIAFQCPPALPFSEPRNGGRRGTLDARKGRPTVIEITGVRLYASWSVRRTFTFSSFMNSSLLVRRLAIVPAFEGQGSVRDRRQESPPDVTQC